jgi:hypothetical protein
VSFQASLVEELWRVRCGDGTAHASIWTHPRGWELRVLWEGLPAAHLLQAHLPDLHRAAVDARVRLLRDGRRGLADVRAEWQPKRRSRP